MKEIVIIAHDIRSTHNVGSLLRTAEGLGVAKVYLTGYTPYPRQQHDERLPHLAAKIDTQIAKTALGAENMVDWQHSENIAQVLDALKADGFQIIALEQTPDAVPLPSFASTQKVALVLGREVEGVDPKILSLCDTVVEIPMAGNKESFNVVQAAAMTLYHLRCVA